jgi:hypothetical protein
MSIVRWHCIVPRHGKIRYWQIGLGDDGYRDQSPPLVVDAGQTLWVEEGDKSPVLLACLESNGHPDYWLSLERAGKAEG